MGVRIVLDSTVNVKKELENRFSVVPLMVNFGTESYVDNVDIDNDEFYRLLAKSKVLPTTSQPTPDAFSKVFEEAVNAGDEVVVITISSLLSGTYQSANIAAADFEGKVFVVDSYTVTIGAGILAEIAIQLADSGKSAAEIAAELENKKQQVRVFAVLDTLEYLKKGGRISATAAFAGGLLNFKPIIAIKDGEVKFVTKGRGNKQANEFMNREVLKNEQINREMPMLLGYTGEDSTRMMEYIKENEKMVGRTGTDIAYTQIGSVVGTHAGPGAVAIAYFAK